MCTLYICHISINQLEEELAKIVTQSTSEIIGTIVFVEKINNKVEERETDGTERDKNICEGQYKRKFDL